MNVSLRRLVLLLLVAAGAGCAAGGIPREPITRRSSDYITTEEIRRSTASNAFDLVQSLRPGWLRMRGLQSLHNEGEILVYFDQVRLGGLQSLRSISVNSIGSLQFIDAASATQRWGTGHNHGAILIFSPTGRY